MSSKHSQDGLQLNVLDVVALVEDLPDLALLRGQVGTIIERLDSGTYEVEFSDDEGCTYAQVSLCSNQLLRLHHRPQQAA